MESNRADLRLRWTGHGNLRAENNALGDYTLDQWILQVQT